jgi:sec-independent protein translocase protein TatA
MFGIGDVELLILAVVALLLFGNKLPAMMRKLGGSLSEFKRAMEQTRENVRKSIEESDRGKEGGSEPRMENEKMNSEQ